MTSKELFDKILACVVKANYKLHTFEQMWRCGGPHREDSGNVAMVALQETNGALILLHQLRTSLDTESRWLPIDTRPLDEVEPYLVRTPGNDVCKTLAVQVSNFEGAMYADHLDGSIDYGDRITDATGWMPLPK